MIESKEFDCVGLGLCPIDYLCVVPSYPKPNEKTEAVSFSQQGGGPVATAMVALSRLGGKAAFVGKVGADVEGEFVRAQFQWEGVDYSRVLVDKEVRTPQAFVWIDGKTGERSIVLNRTEWNPPAWEQIDHDVFTKTRYLHIDGRFPELEIPAAEMAKANGAKIVMDVGSVRDEMESFFRLVDYFVASETFFSSHFPGRSLEEGLQEILRKGPSVAIVTLGERGVWGADRFGLHKIPAFSVSVADTTGAGDVFHGAFIFALLKKWDFKKQLIFASAVAALKCTQLGGRKGIPSYLETIQFLRNNGQSEF